MADLDPHGGWPRGWAGHRTAQLKRLADLSLAEKLAWLEAAQRTIAHLDSQRPSTTTAESRIAAGHGRPRTPESR